MLRVAPVHDSVIRNQAVIVRLVVENPTVEPISVVTPFLWPGAELHFEVEAPNGQPLEGANLSYPDDSPLNRVHEFTSRIPPGAFVGREFVLSTDLGSRNPGFVFSTPGRHRIRAMLRVFAPSGGEGAAIWSNTAEVVILPTP